LPPSPSPSTPPSPPYTYHLSLHDALPISLRSRIAVPQHFVENLPQTMPEELGQPPALARRNRAHRPVRLVQVVGDLAGEVRGDPVIHPHPVDRGERPGFPAVDEMAIEHPERLGDGHRDRGV